jgi:hypothetical protein
MESQLIDGELLFNPSSKLKTSFYQRPLEIISTHDWEFRDIRQHILCTADHCSLVRTHLVRMRFRLQHRSKRHWLTRHHVICLCVPRKTLFFHTTPHIFLLDKIAFASKMSVGAGLVSIRYNLRDNTVYCQELKYYSAYTPG